MRLFLIRHGQTAANTHSADYPWDNDCSLTAAGKQEVDRTAQFLRHLQLDNPCIVSSPLVRTQQTATALAQAMAVPVNTDSRLIEGNVGTWHSESDKHVYDNFLKLPVDERFIFAPPGGESWQQSGDRLVSVVQSNHDRAILILVSHFEPLLAGTGLLLQTDFSIWSTYDFPNASITSLHGSGSNWQADYIGRTL